MSNETILTPKGRLVQGSPVLKPKTDMENKPVLVDGKPVLECFMALAVPKNDPDWPRFHAELYNKARQSFPHLLDAQGNITHPRFAFKVQDGDGVDSAGKSVKDKPGHAGHWIVKMATRYAPRCYYEGKFDPMQVIQDPENVIKRGYYIRCGVTITGNGVMPNNSQAVPGLFISPTLVSFMEPGEEIVSGPNAADVFSKAPAPAYTGPAAPGMVPPPAPGSAPPAPGMTPPAPPAAAPPAPPAPQYVMLPAAMGATREALHGAGWTDELLVQHGMMQVQ